MNKKCCLYKDCNITSLNAPHLTLFQFPKGVDRFVKWAANSRLDKKYLNDRTPKFLCEKHFSKIYLVKSQRRKLLLQSAIPFVYGTEIAEDQENDEEMENNSLEYMEIEDPKYETLSVEEANPVETIEEVEIFIENTEKIDLTEGSSFEPYVENAEQISFKTEESQISSSYENIPIYVNVSSTAAQPPVLKRLNKINLSKHRKINKSTETKSPLKPIVSPKTTANQEPEVNSSSFEEKEVQKPVEVTKEPKKSEEIIKKAEPTINEFIFKGEEYVQLSRANYFGELESLQKTVESLKVVLQNIQNQMQIVTTESKEKDADKEGPSAGKNEDFFEFIFKGEEYVQLPKASYYSGIEELKKKVESQKSILRNIKNYIEAVDLS